MTDKKIIIEAVAWNDEAQTMLTPAVPFCNILDIKSQVESGAILFKLRIDGYLAAYYVLRVDELEAHNEAVIIAAAGAHKDFDLTLNILPIIEQQFKNCSFLRIHTARAGLVRKLAAIGYNPMEFVMRKALNAAL